MELVKLFREDFIEHILAMSRLFVVPFIWIVTVPPSPPVG